MANLKQLKLSKNIDKKNKAVLGVIKPKDSIANIYT